ncbi:MAG TPA: hypothetical protein VGQ80_05310, partial [Acidimicrobiia bacterium]|nr:hypothetical protein [Acidimicrobiia bacterium]
LYFCQGSNTAMGDADPGWGMRPERQLSAAILRLDVSKVTPGQPLDAKTADGGGTYDPFAPGAALTVYASGVRNAFRLLFTADGTLYAPGNGSSAGASTPGYTAGAAGQVNGTRLDTGRPYAGPDVPALPLVQQVENDYLFKITPGGYYGHPNPARGEFVLDGGNPTAGVDPAEVMVYPVGTQPDANYKGFAYDFGQHRSPDGIIEYHGTAFNGALDGKLLVTDYSGGNDVLVLTRGAGGSITNAQHGAAGLTGFRNPVDLIEDPATGDLYVAELGGQKLTLLTPIGTGATITPAKSLLVLNSVAPGGTGPSAAGPGPAGTLTITNTGTAPLTFPAGGFTISDDPADPGHGGDFRVSNFGSIPDTVLPGRSVDVKVTFTAPAVGLFSAVLHVRSNDADHPSIDIPLRGLGTAGVGGSSEPSLARILRAYHIPTIVGMGPTDSNDGAGVYPVNPDPSSEEVVLQRLVKAGDGPVTITDLADFVGIGNPSVRFGYYTPGNPTARTELFTIDKTDNQTTSPTPRGATTFDPGSDPFGFYFVSAIKDNGANRVGYSEDALNTWDTTQQRKFRFFPLKNPDGSVVPNAYVVATTEWNAPPGYNFN